MWRHPKYYKELRKRNKLDQAISSRAETSGTSVRPDPGDQAISTSGSTERSDKRSPGPGLKQQAASSKPQASSTKLIKK